MTDVEADADSKVNPEHIIALEEMLFDQGRAASQEKAATLLSQHFVEFGRSGKVYDKDEVIRRFAEKDEDLGSELEAYDYRLKPIAETVVLLTYRTTRRRSDGEVLHSLRSSIWTLVGSDWQMVFHQGTPTNLEHARASSYVRFLNVVHAHSPKMTQVGQLRPAGGRIPKGNQRAF